MLPGCRVNSKGQAQPFGVWPHFVAAPQGAPDNSPRRKPWVDKWPTELFFCFCWSPGKGDRRVSVAPTGAHTDKEKRTRGLSFTHGSRRGLLSIVPSALEARRFNDLHLPLKTATPAARKKGDCPPLLSTPDTPPSARTAGAGRAAVSAPSPGPACCSCGTMRPAPAMRQRGRRCRR
jgi:hypothetical protein